MINQSTIDELVNRNDPEIARANGSYKQGWNGHGSFDSFDISKEDIDRWAATSNLTRVEFCNALGLFLALGFSQGKLPFYFCDTVANRIWNHINPTNFDTAGAPEIFWSVYWAFDAGEYYRDQQKQDNPSEDYTRPMINDLLSKQAVPNEMSTLVNKLEEMPENREFLSQEG